MIFDEASQIPVEEAVPALYRAHQVIVVGDEMQLPPTTFFAPARRDDEELVVEDEGERDRGRRSTPTASCTQSRAQPAVHAARLALPQPLRVADQLLATRRSTSGNLLTIPDRSCRRRRSTETRGRRAGGRKAPRTSTPLLARADQLPLPSRTASTSIARNPAEADYIAQLVRELLRARDGHEHRHRRVFRSAADRDRKRARAAGATRRGLRRAARGGI